MCPFSSSGPASDFPQISQSNALLRGSSAAEIVDFVMADSTSDIGKLTPMNSTVSFEMGWRMESLATLGTRMWFSFFNVFWNEKNTIQSVIDSDTL